MRVPSVAPCGAVPWVPSSKAQRGNGIGETHEEGGNCIYVLFSLAHRIFCNRRNYYTKFECDIEMKSKKDIVVGQP